MKLLKSGVYQVTADKPRSIGDAIRTFNRVARKAKAPVAIIQRLNVNLVPIFEFVLEKNTPEKKILSALKIAEKKAGVIFSMKKMFTMNFR